MNPIIIAHHLIFTAYGWWLPNDLRGSSSNYIASDLLAELGELHHGRKSVQPARRELLKFFHEAESMLRYPRVEFSEREIELLAASFSEVIAGERYTCYACAIMPDHVHLLIRKHKHLAEEMIANFQRESHLKLRVEGARELDHPVWAGHGWKVFLDHPDDIRRTIRYIENNPIKIRRAKQVWSFVKQYDGWPLHPGHSPNSPYVKRLREAGML